jgi:hypothetical protein
MRAFTVVPSSIATILGQLGDPNAVGEGYVYERAIPNGQIVAPNDFGG